MKPWKFWLTVLGTCALLPVGGFLAGQMSGTWAIAAFCVGFCTVVTLKVSDAVRSKKTEPSGRERFDTTPADVTPLDSAPDEGELPPAA